MSHNAKKIESNIVEFKSLDNRVKTILEKAVEAREAAYCPYSKFKVGACLETADGELIKGCNVENASFTVGLCAERCAYVKAISEGKRNFKTVAVIAHQDHSYVSPCGACRQFMWEFGDLDVFLAKPELKQVMHIKLSELLPYGFRMEEAKC